MDRFGDNVYNLYGSTEVAYATVATPEDLRAAPGTAGKPPRGTKICLYDEAGKEVPQGEVGRIFVGNEMAFEGYTGGGGKEVIDGLYSSGDVGHFDSAGRLFIDGRDDEMIVSGGENVFPREVEDLLADHDAVVEVAVIGVEDDEFGQRLKAFVVVEADTEVSAQDLTAHVKANLASYKSPREIEFLDELPRNATGKVLKRDLRARESERPPPGPRLRIARGMASGAGSSLRWDERASEAAAAGRRGDARCARRRRSGARVGQGQREAGRGGRSARRRGQGAGQGGARC